MLIKVMMKQVAIVGAGTSGLTAIKCCLEEGLEPVCYEKSNDIGGLWCFREGKQNDGFHTTSVFRSTIFNTSKELTAFCDFPMPKDYPNLPHNKQVYQYLNSYADKFNLKKHIIFNTKVKMVSPADDYDCTGRWKLELVKMDGCKWIETFDAVLLCNGHYEDPLVPDFPGLKDFEGEILHTKDYKRPGGYEDQRILLIGTGNSAADAAVELARIADVVYMSTRDGAWVAPRLEDNGLPYDIIFERRVRRLIPSSFSKWRSKRRLNSRFDHTIHPLKANYGVSAKFPIRNDELPYQIVNGNIVIKPNVVRFSKTGVEFEDRTYEDIDCVIMCTGYIISFPIESSLVSVNGNKFNLYQNMFPPKLKHSTLAVIGLTQGPRNPISEMQCRWATRLIKGICKLPTETEITDHIKKYKESLKKKLVDCPRNTIYTDYIPYMDEIATKIGVKPNLGKLFLRDPLLAIQCYFGPCYPYQYRLMGPGRWDGAKEAIVTAWDRVTGAYQTRKVPEDEVSHLTVIFGTLGLAILFAAIMYALIS